MRRSRRSPEARRSWRARSGGASTSTLPLDRFSLKFNNNQYLAQLLLDTGDDNLVYKDDSAWWGNGNGKPGARNLVGKELMIIRSQLRKHANA